MANLDIKIISSDITTGLLELSDRGHTKAKKKDVVTWKKKSGSQVESFRIVEKNGSDPIWSEEPHQVGNHWMGEIHPGAPDHSEYGYSIYWRRTPGGQEYHHDPIISIKPSLHDEFIIAVVAFVTAILALLGIKFLLDKKKKK